MLGDGFTALTGARIGGREIFVADSAADTRETFRRGDGRLFRVRSFDGPGDGPEFRESLIKVTNFELHN